METTLIRSVGQLQGLRHHGEAHYKTHVRGKRSLPSPIADRLDYLILKKTVLYNPKALQIDDCSLRLWDPAIISILYKIGCLARDTLRRMMQQMPAYY